MTEFQDFEDYVDECPACFGKGYKEGYPGPTPCGPCFPNNGKIIRKRPVGKTPETDKDKALLVEALRGLKEYFCIENEGEISSFEWTETNWSCFSTGDPIFEMNLTKSELLKAISFFKILEKFEKGRK